MVVTVVVFIVSEKVTKMLSLIETPLWLSVGEIDETVGAVVVVVVLSVVVVAVAVYSSSSSLQEMMVRLKQEISKMNNPFFIFSSIPKVKHYCLFHEHTKYNINRFVLQFEGDFTWRVSDCEELVGVTHRR